MFILFSVMNAPVDFAPTSTPSTTMATTMAVAIFASGTGTNAERFFQHFKKHPTLHIALLVCNKPNAPVLDKAKQHGVPTFLCRDLNPKQTNLEAKLKEHNIQWIVLAGFLRLIPAWLIQQYDQKIFNLHPALLPKYGGKGMYGRHVHEAVLANREKRSGITIHLVNEEYDKGRILAREKLKIRRDRNVHTLQQRIHKLEHKHYPLVVEGHIRKTTGHVVPTGSSVTTRSFNTVNTV